MPLDTVDRLLPGYQKAAESLLRIAQVAENPLRFAFRPSKHAFMALSHPPHNRLKNKEGEARCFPLVY